MIHRLMGQFEKSIGVPSEMRDITMVAMSPIGPIAGYSSASCDKHREVKGVGYRIYTAPVPLDKCDVSSIRLLFDVGTSDPLIFDVPQWAVATVDSTGTKMVLKPSSNATQIIGTGQTLQSAMGDLSGRIARLRRRSPYTGNGIIEVGKVYPSLKSTKTSKK